MTAFVNRSSINRLLEYVGKHVQWGFRKLVINKIKQKNNIQSGTIRLELRTTAPEIRGRASGIGSHHLSDSVHLDQHEQGGSRHWENRWHQTVLESTV